MKKHRLAHPDGAQIQVLVLGEAGVPVVFVPGSEDGLFPALERIGGLAVMLRRRSLAARICIVSRRVPLPEHRSTEQHAADVVWTLDQIGWGPSIFDGYSAGGPIVQAIAAQHPERVAGVVLESTFTRVNERMAAVLGTWSGLARAGQWGTCLWRMAQDVFRPQTAAALGYVRPFMGLLRPRERMRLVNLLDALIMTDTRAHARAIACPALVIGGQDDGVVEAELQRELAGLIPGARLRLFPAETHGSLFENAAHDATVLEFYSEAWDRFLAKGATPHA